MADSDPRPAASRTRLLVASLIAALVLAAAMGLLWRGEAGTSPGEVGDFLLGEAPAARSAASRVTDLLMNYDAESIDEVGSRLIELSTGNFRSEYERLLPDLGPALRRSGASSEGRIVEGPDVTFSSGTQAVAIERVVQTTRSRSVEERTIAYTLKIMLVKDGDTWKADGLEFLSRG